MADDALTGNPVRELAKRFAITLFLGLVVYRLGAFVPIPAVQVDSLKEFVQSGEGSALGSVLQMMSMFNGGTIMNSSIFGLGIMPYISASIILQILAFSYPALKALQKEGEAGRRKINQYTRYATVGICVIQSGMAAWGLYDFQFNGVNLVDQSVPKALFILQTILVVTTGSMALLWIAEQITKFGVGNGVSVIIMVSVLASFPQAIGEMLADSDGTALAKFLGLIALFLVIIYAMVGLTQARRMINLEQQRKVQGNKVYGGAQTQLPLMLNQAGVIPVIFAQPVLVVLMAMAGMGFLAETGLAQAFGYSEPLYRVVFAALIIFFTFFYISITVDLNEWANNFKQGGFFIRGVRPGLKTVEYLKYRMQRITFVGASTLAAIAIVPTLVGELLGFSTAVSQFILGGVGLLIVVGVSLDIIQKTMAYLLAHQYQSVMNGDKNKKQTGRLSGGTKRF